MPPTERRQRTVRVAGLGVVASLGVGVAPFWARCLAGDSVVEPIPEAWRRYADLKSPYWSPLGDWRRETPLLTRIERKHLDPATELAVQAAGQAVADAGRSLVVDDAKRNRYRLQGLDGERGGIFLGTGIGGIHTSLGAASFVQLDRQKRRLTRLARELAGQGHTAAAGEIEAVLEALPCPRLFDPFSLTMAMPNASAAQLAIKLGLQGPCRTFTCACAAGTVAIGQAARAIRDGECDLALAGGTDFLSDPYGHVFRGFDALGALAGDALPAGRANRPFDEARSGFLFAEGGAALLLLEAIDSAEGVDGVQIAGYGESCDARSIVAIDPAATQVRRSINEAIRDAGWAPAEVDYVNAHGTGTPANDPVEATVLDDLFGSRPAVNSSKSLLGHTLGASGALEAVITVKSLQAQRLHPSRNLERPIADLGFVTAVQSRQLRRALSVSFAFGGQNAVLAIERGADPAPPRRHPPRPPR